MFTSLTLRPTLPRPMPLLYIGAHVVGITIICNSSISYTIKIASYPGLPMFFNVSREKSNVEKHGKAWVHGYCMESKIFTRRNFLPIICEFFFVNDYIDVTFTGEKIRR